VQKPLSPAPVALARVGARLLARLPTTRSSMGRSPGSRLVLRCWLGGQRLRLLAPRLTSPTQSPRSAPHLRRASRTHHPSNCSRSHLWKSRM